MVDHLWACCTKCTKDLENSIWQQVGKNIDTEEELVELMRKLGVNKRNVLLNKVAFLDMSQHEGEPAKIFVARLKGQAAVCDFTLPQGSSDYTDQMVQHQLIRGLRDDKIQEHILAHAATTEGSKMDLAMTVNMVEAKECGKQDAESLHKSSNVNRLSDYKKVQGSSLRDNQVEASVKFENRAASEDDVCRYCCQKGHGSGSNQKVREKFCPAFGKVCGKCGKLDHFKQACLRKRDGAGGDVKKTEGEIAVIGVGERSSEDEGAEDEPIGYIPDQDFLAMSAWTPMSREGGARDGALHPGPAL